MCGRGTLKILSTLLHLRMVGVGTGRAAGTQREDLLGGTQELGGLARKCTWLCVYGVHYVCAHT